MSEKGYVYRFLGENGELLYIGKTKNIDKRLKQHKQNGHLKKEQYSKVHEIQYLEVPTMNDAGILERYLISKEKPEFNTQFANEGECTTNLIICNAQWKPYVIADSNYSFVQKCNNYSSFMKEYWARNQWTHSISCGDDMMFFYKRSCVTTLPILTHTISEAERLYIYLKKSGKVRPFLFGEIVERIFSELQGVDSTGNVYVRGVNIGKIEALNGCCDAEKVKCYSGLVFGMISRVYDDIVCEED